MPPLRVLIVDDEPPAAQLLSSLVTELDGFDVAAVAHDVPAALAQLEQQEVDLVLLDIAMPGEDGFSLIEQFGIERMPFVIFVTAHGDHALRAFDVRALDYLLKPVTVARFQAALQRAAELINNRPRQERQPRLLELIRQLERSTITSASNTGEMQSDDRREYLKQLVIKTRDGIERVPIESIIWCEADDHYVRVHTSPRSYLYTINLSALSQELDPESFGRVRRDAIVRYAAIEAIKTGAFGRLQLLLPNKLSIMTSRALDPQIKLRCLAQAKSGK